MTRETVKRLVRRAAVLAATAAVIAVGVVSVQLATQWRAEAAPLDVAPVSMQTINDQVAAEADRSAQLSDQIDEVAASLTNLKTALLAADGSIGSDQQTAEVLRTDIATAGVKLETLKSQLKAAQTRLTALNKAAARQAAINRAAKVSTTTTAPAGGDDD